MRLRSAAATAALILPLSACSGSNAQVNSPASAPQLTKAQAQEVLGAYQTVNNQANRNLDERLLGTIETGAQLDMDAAGYRLRRQTKQAFADFTYTKPVFYIPRLTGYPRWFAVSASSRQAGAGGHRQRGSTRRHALLFVQDSRQAPWRLAADPYPTTGRQIGAIALDRDGYATAVRPDDTRLALSPAKVPAAHAALLNGGPADPKAAGIGTGPHTTQAYDALKQAIGQFTRIGVGLKSHFTPSDTPVYALRTADGGALAWYVLRQNEQYTARKPGAIAVTGDLVGLAPPGKVKKRLDTSVLIQYLGAIPPKGKGAVQVTGTYRKAVRAVPS